MKMQLEQKLNFYIFRLDGRQWGHSRHGTVAFPVAFTAFRRLVTNHPGVSWRRSQAREVDSLVSFTLDVESNSSSDDDAQWIAVGK